tara:strand:- start:1678 stop:1890 length:213 start_codon:yes stop_codon:yes gene_type:complete
MDINEKVDLMIKQTDCSRERCIELLTNNDNDIMKALMQHLNIKKKEEIPCTTSNQERYRLMRNLMDESHI